MTTTRRPITLADEDPLEIAQPGDRINPLTYSFTAGPDDCKTCKRRTDHKTAEDPSDVRRPRSVKFCYVCGTIKKVSLL